MYKIYVPNSFLCPEHSLKLFMKRSVRVVEFKFWAAFFTSDFFISDFFILVNRKINVLLKENIFTLNKNSYQRIIIIIKIVNNYLKKKL